MSERKILIIEDEIELADILGAYMQVEGFEAQIANDGASGLQRFYEFQPDLLLLDIMLPGKDGISICKEVRETSDIPIIMVSAKSGEMDKVICLGIGADDYVTKPYSPLELVARVKAQLRRYDAIQEKKKESDQNMTMVGKLVLNHSAYTASIGDEMLNLTTKEFELLYYFAKNQNIVLSKEQIYQTVWGYTDSVDDNSVTVYIKRIREKLAPYHLDYIKTVWGAGYKFVVS